MALIPYFHQHLATVIVFAFCAWVSISLILRLWLTHRKDSTVKKLAWSLLLCVPAIGWVFYGALYTPLPENTVKTPINRDAFYGGT